jgi:hypothetical protein
MLANIPKFLSYSTSSLLTDTSTNEDKIDYSNGELYLTRSGLGKALTASVSIYCT